MFRSLLTVASLYKYLKPKWADAMVRAGSIHVGTLNTYRELEAEDPERGDIGEGTRTLHSDDKPRVYNSTAELPPSLSGIECGKGGLATNGPNAIVIKNRVADAYVYCVTERFDAAVMGEFGGACVRIEEPSEFFEAVDGQFKNHLHELGRVLGNGTLDRCVYAERRENYHATTPVDTCFLKPPRYERQCEVRAIWRPAQLPIAPVSFECPAGARYCRRHA